MTFDRRSTSILINGLPLRLYPLTGPEIEAIVIEPQPSVIVGRSSTCDVHLPDQAVSRRHLRLACRGGGWIATDLGSRHGTSLGGVPLRKDESSPLANGDTLAIGPWIFRVQLGADLRTGGFETTNDVTSTRARVVAVTDAELSNLAEKRLNLLMECAARIHSSETEVQLAEAALEAVLDGTGFIRGALVKPIHSLSEVEVISRRISTKAHRRTPGPGAGPGLSHESDFAISRSLLAAASEGRIVRLAESQSLREAVSIIEMGVQAAICAPVQIGTEVQAFLYIDTRESTARVEPDAPAFCGAIARMCGLALANIQRASLHQRQRHLEADLNAARDAQTRMMPPEAGAVGPIRYAMRSVPGRVVAGDLFDLFALDSKRVAVCLGDVTGKGMGSAMLMAMTQSFLRASLQRDHDLAKAMASLNEYLHDHSAPHEFVSMFAAIIDAESRTMTFVDAGHGYAAVVPPTGAPESVRSEGSMLLGVQSGTEFAVESMPFEPGARLVIVSDGVVEQRAPEAGMFGLQRILDIVGAAGAPEADVTNLLSDLLAFAETTALSDDVTIVSLAPE